MRGAAGFLQHMREWSGSLPIDAQLIAEVREAIRVQCSAIPAWCYDPPLRAPEYERTARRAISSVLIANFPNSLKSFRVKGDRWPYAHCIISQGEAIIEFSFSETDAWMGGICCEPVRILMDTKAPNAKPLKQRVREVFGLGRAEQADTGEELLLTQPAPQPVTQEPSEQEPATPAPSKPLPPGMQAKQFTRR